MPQPSKRVKIRRKDLRGPDEFETLTGRALAWAEEHRQVLLGGLGALLVVVALVLIVGRVNTSRNASAGEGFRRAQAAFQGSRFPEAASGFADVARDYPRTPYGRLAVLYRGHALAQQGDPTGAATAYGEYLATSPEPYLRQEALVGLGHAKEASADAAGALDGYLQAAELEGPFRTDALVAAGRLHEAAGRADQARELYARALKDGNPDPELRTLLIAKLPAGHEAAQTATP